MYLILLATADSLVLVGNLQISECKTSFRPHIAGLRMHMINFLMAGIHAQQNQGSWATSSLHPTRGSSPQWEPML